MVRRVASIILDPASSKREVVSASRVLIAAEQQNQQDQMHNEQADEGRNRFYAIADRLGLLAGTAAIPEGGTSSDHQASQRIEHADDIAISDVGEGKQPE